jgi:hypothetical protein
VITDSFPGKGDKFSVRILSLKADGTPESSCAKPAFSF